MAVRKRKVVRKTARKPVVRRTIRRAAAAVKRTVRRGASRAKQAGAVDIIETAAIGIGGAIGVAFALNKIGEKMPQLTPTVRAGIAVGLGIFGSMQKNQLIKKAAAGVAVAGGMALLKSVVPAIPSLAGDDDYSSYNFGEYSPQLITAEPVSVNGFGGGWNHNG
jgi:hypothetical protein